MPTYTYSCKCGELTDRTFTSYIDKTETTKCSCGARAEYDFGATAAGGTLRSGDHWAKGGGWDGNDGDEGSLSRATTVDMVAGERKFDREHGVSQHVEYVCDKKDPEMLRPKFKSLYGRRAWDKAHNFNDGS